jgi:hypothetical protein
VESPRLGGKFPLENEPNAFAEPGTRESDVTISIVSIGGVDCPVRVMVRVGIILFEQVNRLFSGLSIVVGWPGEIFLRSVWGNAEEVVPLHHCSREFMCGNGLEVGRRGDELKDVIDFVLFEAGRIHFL